MTDLYGVRETFPLTAEMKKAQESVTRTVDWTQVHRITRLRLLSDPGFPAWDVSYCTGVMEDGEVVAVSLPFHQLPKRGFRRAIVEYAKRDGIFAKGIGILDNVSTLC